MTIQAKVETLRKLLEAKMEKCPVCKGTGTIWERHEPPGAEQLECGNCGGTGRIPEPAYVPLLKVVLDLTPNTTEVFRYDKTALTPLWLQRCYGCFAATRSWEGLPKGALAGALYWALWEASYREADLHSTETPTHKALVEARRQVEGEIVHGWPFEDNPDEAALDAVIEALEPEGGE